MNDATIIKAVEGVTGRWSKQRKAEQRDQSRRARRMDALNRSYRRETVKEVAYDVMEAAYLKASGDGKYPAHARQIMYAARGAILKRTGKHSFNDAYFTQTLLPDFMAEFALVTADWDVVFDARGHLIEPHTDREVKLGTIDVRCYIADSRRGGRQDIGITDFATDYPTHGPNHRYGAVLFIEK
jgi:hypothetical protein